MGYTPFAIADLRVGMERDVEPWLLPKDAYPDLEDCYMFRGRIIKRQGFSLLGRLNRQIGTTDGSGDATITLPHATPLVAGSSFFTIGATTLQDSGSAPNPTTLLLNGSATLHTLNRTTGVLTITGASINTAVVYYPGLPVMGLRNLEATSGAQEIIDATDLIAFDTVFAYLYDTTTNLFQDLSFYWGTSTLVTWSGSNSAQFWSANYGDAMWATNFVYGFQGNSVATTPGMGDGIRWLDQKLTQGWVNFLPKIDGTPTYLMGCLMIIPYKNRLVVLNTWEGPNYAGKVNFAQRARWSQNGTPFYTTDQSGNPAPKPSFFQGGTDNDAWRSDIVGKGGFIDAPTQEQIVSCQFLRDTLVVYFETSTWNLRYTGNETLPFVWEKINTELGSISTFSTVPFDKIVIGVGNVGIHACDTVNVERIDQKIPDEVFAFQIASNGNLRVSGIRDYYNQLVYWSVPYTGNLPPPGIALTFPNKLLVYNYIDQSFSYFNDSFTCFGYFQSTTDPDSLKWNSTETWESTQYWIDPRYEAEFLTVIGGNQEGYVERLMQGTPNDVSLTISNISNGTGIITCVNHNLTLYGLTFQGPYVMINGAPGMSNIGTIHKVININSANEFVIDIDSLGHLPTGTYLGGGSLSIVNNMSIWSKRFSPFIEQASQARLGYTDFYLDRTTSGQITVYIYLDDDVGTPIDGVIATYPESTYQTSPDTGLEDGKLWKRAYMKTISQMFQYQLTMSNDQMLNTAIANSEITLHAMILYFSKSGRLIYV